MEQKNRFLKLYEYMPFIIFLIFSFYLHKDVGLREYDDYVYRDQWLHMSVLEWMKQFYLEWSGRIPLHIIYILFLQLPVFVWRIWNSVLYVLAAYFVSRAALVYSQGKNRIATNVMICVSFALIPDIVLDRVIFWIAGSFNYLLPGVALFVALYPILKMLRNESVDAKKMLISYMSVLLCCYAEQTAAVFVCMSCLAIIYMLILKYKVYPAYWGLFLFGFVNMLIEYIAPGNQVRYDAELILWFPQYDMYSLLDKLLMGFLYSVKMLLTDGWPVFLLVFWLILPKIIKESWFMRVYYIVTGLYTVGLYIIIGSIDENALFTLEKNKSTLLVLSVVFGVLLWLVLFFISYMEDTILALTIVFSGLAAIASGAVAVVSPSYIVSEQRVFFVSYMLLIFIVGLQIQGISDINYKKGVFL